MVTAFSLRRIGTAALFVLVACGHLGAEPAIDGDFPGGNIIVDKIEPDAVYLRQDQRDTEYPWFYWQFRVRGAEGRSLTFHFTQNKVLGLRGPAFSRDAGRSWAWLGEGAKGDHFTFAFSPDDRDVRFCFGIPYLQTQLDEFLSRHKDTRLTVESLCRTRAGRSVELLRLGRQDGGEEHRVLLTARHHACEMPSGYMLEGLIAAALADTEDGRWLCEHVQFWIVPFVDKDGVEAGDQGKLRQPHDPWLDYADESLYPAVAALRQQVPPWCDDRLRVALDCHAPSLWDERIYFADSPRADIAAGTDRFCKVLRDAQTGPLVYEPGDNLAYGTGWNNAATYGALKSFALWAEELPGVRVAATLELPYASVQGREVAPESARAFGADLARGLRQYLESLHGDSAGR